MRIDLVLWCQIKLQALAKYCPLILNPQFEKVTPSLLVTNIRYESDAQQPDGYFATFFLSPLSLTMDCWIHSLSVSLPDHTSLFGQKGDDDHIFQMRLFRIKTNDFLPSKLFFPILWICDCQRPLFPLLLSSMSFTRSNFAENYTVNSG